MTNPKAPTLKGLPKTHKEDIPVRPVVNFQNAPTYKICKFLNNKIKQSIVWEQNFNIRNTIELINKIKDIEIPEHSMLISFDIKDMYSNIPPNETLLILKEDLLNSNTLEEEAIQDIINLTKNCTDQNYFKFNNKFYQQKDGLPMGSPLSGLLADIYIHKLETDYIMSNSNPFKNQIIYWYRYVDDIICLFNGNEEKSEHFLNSLNPKIIFTKETQIQSINFLDLTISNFENIHKFQIYRKPQHSDLTIPANSHHPWNYKLAGFRSMVHRLLNVPMDKMSYNKEKDIIKFLAVKNGYNVKTIDKMIQTTKKKKHSNRSNVDNSERKKYISVPYNTLLNKATRKTFQKTKFIPCYKTRNNTFYIINKLTDKQAHTQINNYDRSGIYKIHCDDCDSFYIGQTGRNFTLRFKEHIQALRTQNTSSMKSNFADHLIKFNHNYTNIEHNMKILAYESKGEKMNSKENYYIYIHNKTQPDKILNTHITNNNPIYEKIWTLQKDI